MSLHRVIAPPPLALAVHPAPPPKTREEVRKEDEKRRADRQAKAEADAKAKAAAEGKKEDEGADKKKDDPVVPAPDPDTPAVKKEDSPDVPDPKSPSADKEKTPEAEVKEVKPLPPLRLLPPVPHRPLRSRLDLDPARPYPPINSDPRGAYNPYAKAMLKEVMYIDVTKDGWLTEQWREKSEREALARLTGEAEKQHLREVAKAQMEGMVRKVPKTAEGLILELWNDLVESKDNELSVEAFWARYDWTDPKAEKHLQIMPFEEKEKAKAAEIRRVEKEVKAEEAATLARRAAREKDRLAEEEKKKHKAEEAKEAGENKESEKKEKKVEDEKEKEEEVGEKATTPEADAKVDAAAEEKPTEPIKNEEPEELKYKYRVEVEWTREGVEETPATVGIQCAFNTEKPLPRHWSTPSGAYLLLAHNHFLLRIESDIQFKPDGPSDKFEPVVTGADDRVFGDIVKKQKAAEQKKKDREYRDRKEREYRERKDRERKERKEKAKEDGEEEGKDENDKDDKVKKGEDGEGKKADAHGKRRRSHAPEPAEAAETPKVEVKPDMDVAVIAVPIQEGEEVEKGLDAKHEEEPIMAKPKLEGVVADLKEKTVGKTEHGKEENKKADKDQKGEGGQEDDNKDDIKPAKDDRDKRAKKAADEAAAAVKHRPKEPALAGFDPIRDADLLVKMLGPDAANIPLADLKAAFAAMEHAAAEQKAQAKAVGDKRDGPMIWVWHEPCERWRWMNFAAGCAVIEEGAWEERDWKEFADDSGMVEFTEEMEWAEDIERDNHGWTC